MKPYIQVQRSQLTMLQKSPALLLFGSKKMTAVAIYLPLDKSAEVTALAECSSMATSLLELITVICRAGRTACIKST